MLPLTSLSLTVNYGPPDIVWSLLHATVGLHMATGPFLLHAQQHGTP